MPEADERPRLSWSALGDYADCGEKYYLRRVERVGRQTAWYFIGGDAVHRMTQDLDEVWFGVGDEVTKTYEEYFEESLAEALEHAPEGFTEAEIRAGGRKSKANPNAEDKGWWLEHGPTFVEAWVNWRNNSTFTLARLSTGDPGIEVPVDGYIGGEYLKGTIDRVVEASNGTLGIVDIKTGSSKSDPGQLRVYKRLLEQNYPDMEIKWGAFFYTREANISLPADLVDGQDPRVLDTLFANTGKALNLGLFPPKISRSCGWCEVRDFCVYYEGEKVAQVSPPWDRVSDGSVADAE